MLRNLTKSLRMSQEQFIAKSFQGKKSEVVNGGSQEGQMAPLSVSLNSELEEAAKELKMKQVSELNKLKGHLDFQQYAIKGNDDEWDQALKIKDTTKIAKLVSVKTGEKRTLQEKELLEESTNKIRKKKKHKDKSNPKKNQI